MGRVPAEQAQITDGPLTGLAATAALRLTGLPTTSPIPRPTRRGTRREMHLLAWIPAAGISWAIARALSSVSTSLDGRLPRAGIFSS